MSQLAAHNLAMSNFYGIHQGGQSTSQKEEEQPVQGVIRYASMIVGLLSLFTIIALNVTNIIYMTESGGTMQSIKNAQGSIDGSMKDLSGTIMEDIKPKTDLINSMVSYNIPAQLSMIHQIIKNDVLKQCTPSFMFNNTICPLAENPTHSRYFEEVNLDSISECSGNEMSLELGTEPEFIEYPSFAPGSTKPGSCVRLPSFSLSSTVFAYTHTIMGHGCSELDVGDHYLAIGRIADAGHEIPQFETISSWFINDKINRRSCTVAAGVMETWMGCVIMTETFYDDLDSLDTGKITISYLDVFGRKKEWIYTRSEILYDYTYTSVYFSIGSGVVVGDTVYFLLWGSLSSPIEETAYCYAPGCSNYNQRMCNEAQRPAKFGHRQMANAILRFKTNSMGKPSISVRTLSPTVIPFGTEGRLIYSDFTKIIYLYLRSTSWYVLPLTGLLILGPPVSISWVTQEAVSRPGEYPCGASNRCPKDCITGVYTDLFPLGARYEYAVTVYLNAETYRVNPTLALIDRSKIIARKKITTESQKAGYTTTTCFVFKLRIWCMSVVELAPATMTAFEPVPFLYQLDLTCKRNNGTTAMQFSGQDGMYKSGRYKSPRNECFFEKVSNKYYFVVSTPEGIQPYEVRDLTPERVSHVIMYISDVCAPALSAFKKLIPAMRPITTLTIGNWQFRPVDISGGLRVNIYRNLTRYGDLSMSAPEDPGTDTFPGTHAPSKGHEEVGHYTLPNEKLSEVTTAAVKTKESLNLIPDTKDTRGEEENGSGLNEIITGHTTPGHIKTHPAETKVTKHTVIIPQIEEDGSGATTSTELQDETGYHTEDYNTTNTNGSLTAPNERNNYTSGDHTVSGEDITHTITVSDRTKTTQTLPTDNTFNQTPTKIQEGSPKSESTPKDYTAIESEDSHFTDPTLIRSTPEGTIVQVIGDQFHSAVTQLGESNAIGNSEPIDQGNNLIPTTDRGTMDNTSSQSHSSTTSTQGSHSAGHGSQSNMNLTALADTDSVTDQSTSTQEIDHEHENVSSILNPLSRHTRVMRDTVQEALTGAWGFIRGMIP
ncbi:attachment glycoprotein [Tailam virus]|uniref:Attachment glycoprotein n=1 Tax=Tailam virus TaxID=1117633 RepID=G9IS03_9MONO|nr:attachment glycoprotein [Tailam virus]AEU08864.1 attachment glycoprotein [Tailam virus]